jgi:hypothetical protein
MPTAIISPCQASVTGPISIVGSIPIVITDGTAITLCPDGSGRRCAARLRG